MHSTTTNGIKLYYISSRFCKTLINEYCRFFSHIPREIAKLLLLKI